MSCGDNCVCRRSFKSRIACRMAFIAVGLTAGLNPQNSEFPREFRTRRGRKLCPRKSNLTFGYLPCLASRRGVIYGTPDDDDDSRSVVRIAETELNGANEAGVYYLRSSGVLDSDGSRW